MRYMMFIKHTEDYRNAKVPASLYEAMGRFIEDEIIVGAVAVAESADPPFPSSRQSGRRH